MRKFILTCAAAAALTACNKEQTLDVPLTRTQMLYGANTTSAAEAMPSKWKTKEYKVTYVLPDGRDTTRTDLYPECQKDDFLQFFENFTGTHHTADNKCSTNEGDIYHTRWEFSQNEEYLNFYNYERLFYGYRTFIVKVKDFSEAGFTLEYIEPLIIDNVLDTPKTIEHKFEKF
jgi:hypothetical protein